MKWGAEKLLVQMVTKDPLIISFHEIVSVPQKSISSEFETIDLANQKRPEGKRKRRRKKKIACINYV